MSVTYRVWVEIEEVRDNGTGEDSITVPLMDVESVCQIENFEDAVTFAKTLTKTGQVWRNAIVIGDADDIDI